MTKYKVVFECNYNTFFKFHGNLSVLRTDFKMDSHTGRLSNLTACISCGYCGFEVPEAPSVVIFDRLLFGTNGLFLTNVVHK